MEMFGRKGKRGKKGKRKNNIKTFIIVFVVVVFACLFLFRFYCVHASNSI